MTELSSRTGAVGQPATPRAGGWGRLVAALTLRALRHPPTAVALLRVGWRFRRRGWWHRPPFLPLPSGDYVRWRMHTAYGDDHFVPPAEDVVRYARWATRDS